MHWLLFAVFLTFAGGVGMAFGQSTGTFTAIGNMSIPRAFHTATLLADGKVLIVGGRAATRLGEAPQHLTSAELYDPNTGTFTPTGNMITPKVSPTATLLNDGRVLIVGASGACLTNSAELYDPTTGMFSNTGGTVTNQIGGTAVLLKDGRVLVAGGWSRCAQRERTPIANAEVYDPTTGTFVAAGPFATTGSSIYFTGGPFISALNLLPDGRVLIAGELNSELYDPATNTFSPTSSMTTMCGPEPPSYIAGRTATLLPNGEVLLTGGGQEDCGRFATAELYDPLTGKFIGNGEMTRQRNNHTATLLPDGTVFIAGGETTDCCTFGTTNSVELYDPSTHAFTVLGTMTARRAGHTVTVLMDGNMLLAGGYGYGGVGIFDGTFASAEVYAPPVPVPSPVVTALRFDQTRLGVGDSFMANFGGSNLTPEMFFDVRFTSPSSGVSNVSLNWQIGPTSTHYISPGSGGGVWAINGVRAHRFENDHTGNFLPVTGTITVSP